MTGQTILNYMELLDAELQNQVGEEDTSKCLGALNAAQDYFESLAALRHNIFESSTSNVTTTANTETTAYPAGCLRIDRMQLLDAAGVVKWALRPLRRVGGHKPGGWLWSYVTGGTTGEPSGYYTNGTSIYWQPLPGGTYTVRVSGFFSAADITAVGTFAYPDAVALPLAAFAVRLIKMGLGDDTQDTNGLASEAFTNVLDTLANAHRDGAAALEYTRTHTE